MDTPEERKSSAPLHGLSGPQLKRPVDGITPKGCRCSCWCGGGASAVAWNERYGSFSGEFAREEIRTREAVHVERDGEAEEIQQRWCHIDDGAALRASVLDGGAVRKQESFWRAFVRAAQVWISKRARERALQETRP